MTATTAFAGFSPAAFTFFEELRDNNEPAWFKPRKAIYEAAVLAPFRDLIVAVGAALGEAGLPLIGDPQRGIFRIYRDVRFSPDKRLYKTHAGAVLTRSGSKRDPGLLYLHVEPSASMVAAGFWHPEPALLHRLRRAILDDPEGFLAIGGSLAAAGYPISSDERLSRPPRGFEAAKGTHVAGHVGWKSFTCHASLSDAEMQSPKLVDRIVGFARIALPLLEWGWAAADQEAPAPLPIRIPARPLPKPDFSGSWVGFAGRSAPIDQDPNPKGEADSGLPEKSRFNHDIRKVCGHFAGPAVLPSRPLLFSSKSIG